MARSSRFRAASAENLRLYNVHGSGVLMNRISISACALLIVLTNVAWAQSSEKHVPAPVIFDTDIGTDIDDAYALVALIRRPELEVLGVTTVSGDAVARARLAAKLLAVAGGHWVSLPVYAGTSELDAVHEAGRVGQRLRLAEPAHLRRRGIHAPRDQRAARRDHDHRGGRAHQRRRAARSGAGHRQKIRAIALMGGAIYRGYAPGSKPEPEWNIKSNAAAARTVFDSGVPLLVAPLDSTADLRLTPEMRVQLFARGTPLNDALAALNAIWRHTNHWKGENPTLFDVLAVELVMPRRPYELTALHIEVAADGIDEACAGRQAKCRGRTESRRTPVHARIRGAPDALNAYVCASLRCTRAPPNIARGLEAPSRRLAGLQDLRGRVRPAVRIRAAAGQRHAHLPEPRREPRQRAVAVARRSDHRADRAAAGRLLLGPHLDALRPSPAVFPGRRRARGLRDDRDAERHDAVDRDVHVVAARCVGEFHDGPVPRVRRRPDVGRAAIHRLSHVHVLRQHRRRRRQPAALGDGAAGLVVAARRRERSASRSRSRSTSARRCWSWRCAGRPSRTASIRPRCSETFEAERPNAAADRSTARMRRHAFVWIGLGSLGWLAAWR